MFLSVCVCVCMCVHVCTVYSICMCISKRPLTGYKEAFHEVEDGTSNGVIKEAFTGTRRGGDDEDHDVDDEEE